MTILLAFLLLAFIITAMSIGVILGRKPIKGSCGGVGAALGEKEYVCKICGDDPNKCVDNDNAESNQTNLAVDATKSSKQ